MFGLWYFYFRVIISIPNKQIQHTSHNESDPDIVKECASRINSKFFSVDAIDRADGCQRIVEIGDGQVSGLVGWSVDRFTSLWVESSP